MAPTTPDARPSRAEGRAHIAVELKRLYAFKLNDEEAAWKQWCVVTRSLFASRHDGCFGARFQRAFTEAIQHAKQMRDFLRAREWTRASLHGLKAENSLLLARIAFLEPLAASHARVQEAKGFADRMEFARFALRLSGRFWKKHGRALTLDELLAETERRTETWIPSDPRVVREWATDAGALSKRPPGRPKKGKL